MIIAMRICPFTHHACIYISHAAQVHVHVGDGAPHLEESRRSSDRPVWLKRGRAVRVREEKMRRKEIVERRRRVPVNSYQGILPLKTIPR